MFILPMPEMFQNSRFNRLGYEVIPSTCKSGITFDACLHLEATPSIQNVTTMMHQNGTTFHIWLWPKYRESKWQTQNMQVKKRKKDKDPNSISSTLSPTIFISFSNQKYPYRSMAPKKKHKISPSVSHLSKTHPSKTHPGPPTTPTHPPTRHHRPP